MALAIIIFVAVISLAGLSLVIRPEIVFGFMRSHADKLILHIWAVVVRLIVGVLLIYQSDVSKFPSVVEALGWIFVIVAFSLSVMGRRNFNRLISWALSLSDSFGRVSGVAGVAFGGFLVYVFL